MKICTQCKIEKELTEFHKHAGRSDGFNNQCKSCSKAYKLANKVKYSAYNKAHWKAYSIANKEKLAAYKKAYYKANKEKLVAKSKVYHKAYSIANKEKLVAKNKAYREANKEKRLETCRKYREKNKEKLLKQAKIYRAKNQEKMNMNNRYRNKHLRKTDSNFKLKELLRGRAYKALVLNEATKSAPTLELLGSSVPYVRKHLESQFVDGMSWDNHGKWHIDHIRPCASFDLTDPEQQKECFNYKNLQPLWAEDNLSKGDRF